MKKLASFLAYFCLFCACYAQAQDKNALFPMPNAQGKWGYVDANNKVVIPYKFDGASPFHEERAFVFQMQGTERHYSVIDTKGNIVFKTETLDYDAPNLCQMHYYRYSDGLYQTQEYVGNKNIYKYLDKAGKLALTLSDDKNPYMIANRFSEGLAYAMLNDSTLVYFDKKGKIALKGYGHSSPAEYDFHNGWAVTGSMMTDESFSYINKKGEKAPFLAKYNLTDLSIMREGYAFLAIASPNPEKQDVSYLILQPDYSTKPVEVPLAYSSPVTYVSGYYFSNGLAFVRYYVGKEEMRQERQGYLNTAGKFAFELPKELNPSATEEHFVMGDNFHNGLACWRIEYPDNTLKIVYLNTAGKIVLESPVVKK
jgi:WG containing repeat